MYGFLFILTSGMNGCMASIAHTRIYGMDECMASFAHMHIYFLHIWVLVKKD